MAEKKRTRGRPRLVDGPVSKPAQTVLKLFDEDENRSLRFLAARVKEIHHLKTYSHQRVLEILERWRHEEYRRAVEECAP